MRWIPLALLLAACSAPLGGVGGDWALPATPHQRLLRVPVDIAWNGLVHAYRDLRIPVAQEDRESWTVLSADIPLGGDDRYVICPRERERRQPEAVQTIGRLTTVLQPENGVTVVRTRLSAWIIEPDGSGSLRRRECVSRGVLEDRAYQALERQAW